MRRARLGGLVLIAALTAGCAKPGVEALSRDLIWGANWLRVTRQAERKVAYTHAAAAPYWVVALPPRSSLFQLGNAGIPDAVVAIVEDCARGGQPILAVVQEQTAECVYPAYPEALNPLVVAKVAGQTATVTLARGDAGVRIVSLE